MDMHGHILKQGLAAAADRNPVQINVAELAVMQGHDLPSSLKSGT
jgi:hypothetical protein